MLDLDAIIVDSIIPPTPHPKRLLIGGDKYIPLAAANFSLNPTIIQKNMKSKYIEIVTIYGSKVFLLSSISRIKIGSGQMTIKLLASDAFISDLGKSDSNTRLYSNIPDTNLENSNPPPLLNRLPGYVVLRIRSIATAASTAVIYNIDPITTTGIINNKASLLGWLNAYSLLEYKSAAIIATPR